MGEGERAAHAARRQAIRRKAQRRHMHFYSRCAHWSFCHDAQARPLRWRRERWILAATSLLLTLLSAVVIPAWASAMKPVPAPPVREVLPLTLPVLQVQQQTPAVEDWRRVRVRPGQTLSDIFLAQGLGFADVQRTLDAGKDASALRNIHPGDEFSFLLGSDGNLQGLRFDRDAAHRVTLRFDRDAVTEAVQARALEQREHVAHGVITGSLFGAAARAGISEGMIVKLADVFKYDIDFIKDIRAGDSFTVIYDDVYRDGAYLHEGDIIAAEFFNQGKRYTAYRFKQADGSIAYYSEDGRPLRKSLLRTPVAFTRISSRFSLARKHPILGYTRAHTGVDYAAPKGTPIHAAGDGVITFRGREHGYGNFVIIRHNATYSTAYGHMSRFAKGERVGEHVRQGEVIGYVGMTGLATGPHLHYEVRVNGKQRNPLTMTMPKPQPLAPKLLAQFKQQMQPMLARLKTIDNNVRLARADVAGASNN
jgi:murein DD-endopeptidase MepM/ murein hydrolase activator NlpD